MINSGELAETIKRLTNTVQNNLVLSFGRLNSRGARFDILLIRDDERSTSNI